jgi:hypothetical protein
MCWAAATLFLAACTTSTSEITPTPSASPSLGAATEVPLPLGTPARLGRWEVSVVRFDPDMTERVEGDMFNRNAREGYQFAMVTMRLRNLGSAPRDPFWDIRSWIVVPQTGEQFHRTRRVLPPNGVDMIELLPPQKGREGNEVYHVRSSVISGDLVFRVAVRSDEAYFALG